VSEYDWSNPRYQPGTGHFSQIVWKSSSKVGCAVSKACEYKTFVCNYNPAGKAHRLWFEALVGSKPLRLS
jgi:hypothetical protein